MATTKINNKKTKWRTLGRNTESSPQHFYVCGYQTDKEQGGLIHIARIQSKKTETIK